MMWGYGWEIGLWWLFGLLLLVGIALLIVLLVRTLAGPATAGPHVDQHQARRILSERYARGELTTEQYREQLRVLSENP
jgi:putative membrane protein